MERNKINLLIVFMLLAASFAGREQAALAQSASIEQRQPNNVRADSRVSYHGGPLLSGTAGVYVIWYGCWDDNCGTSGDTASQFILGRFLENLGGSPYFQINATYPDSQGRTPSGAYLYGGSVIDRYSHGVELTAGDIQEIVSNKIESNGLPQDPLGIYLVFASADVGSLDTGLCAASAQPHHGRAFALGSAFTYGFVGNPVRCPTVGAPQFVAADGSPLPTPNGSFAADGMVSTIAHLLNAIVTNPTGGGWFDRYGLENADKCAGTFGQTYLTANGARANIRLDRDYLIQRNWVNGPVGRCAMQSGEP